MQNEIRNCQNCRNEFTIEPDDFAFYEKMGVPPPGICPGCRFKRRNVFRNERTLYNRKCDLCGTSIVSMYHPKSPYTVYCVPCWDSDKWDPYSYAQEYRRDRSFFEQLGELFRRVPKKALYVTSTAGPIINSDYINTAGGAKNCYLIFNSGLNEDSMYSRGLRSCKDTVDAYFGVKLESCYETVNVQQSSRVMFGQNVVGGLNSIFMRDSSGCTDCFGCVNLRHKTHHFFNESLSKEEYERRVGEIMGSYAKMEEYRKKFEEFSLRFPRRENNNLKSSGCTGDYIFESKNVTNSFEVTNSEDCRECFSVSFAKDSEGLVGYGYHSELLLECAAVGYASRIIGCYATDNSQQIEYSFGISKSKNCIGCDGVKNADYSILNKRYDEKDYGAVRDLIVEELKKKGEYGLFFPPSLSPFAYNESTAHDNVPLTKGEALAEGFRWEEELQATKGKETMKVEDIPDHIRDVSDGITKEIFACIECSRNYKIIPAELAFYRKMILPVPRKCFGCRHMDRVTRRGPFTLYDRTCAKCTKAIRTNYPLEAPDIVYCEECYQKEVV